MKISRKEVLRAGREHDSFLKKIYDEKEITPEFRKTLDVLLTLTEKRPLGCFSRELIYNFGFGKVDIPTIPYFDEYWGAGVGPRNIDELTMYLLKAEDKGYAERVGFHYGGGKRRSEMLSVGFRIKKEKIEEVRKLLKNKNGKHNKN